MKLLYVYFKYHKNCKRIFKDEMELNFDSTCRFSLAGHVLKSSQFPDVLPRGFFSVLPSNGDRSGVDDVSVIVGGNGSGKTTLAAVLVDLKEESEQLSKFEKYIVVYQRWGEQKCYCETNITDLVLPENVARVCKSPSLPTGLLGNVPVVYLTPHFTPYSVVDPLACSTFTDLSVLGAMKHGNERYFNPSGSDFNHVAAADPIAVYRTEQTKHMLSFACGENQLPQKFRMPGGEEDNRPLCEPKGVSISISKVVYQKRASEDVESEVKQILDKVNGKAGEFVVNVFYAYAGLYLHDLPIKTFEEMTRKSADDPDYADQKAAWDEFQSYQTALRDFCLRDGRTDIAGIRRFFTNTDAYPTGSEAIAAKLFFEALIEFDDLVARHRELCNVLVSGSIDNQRVILKEHTPQYLQKVLNLVNLHFKAHRILSFLDFDTFPRMSSGERAFFDTWGRLYHHYRESTDFCNRNREVAFDRDKPETWLHAKDALVFLDEVETTMHPEWQRQLVKRTILFFEAFVPWVHPHIIFATHSPILLSDVPCGNVVRLRLNKEGESEAVGGGEHCTFAANIFDLYKDSFILDNGTTGAFAAGKVNRLLAKLTPVRRIAEGASDDDLARMAREYQQQLLDVKIDADDLKLIKLIGDPFLSRYLWRRLDGLTKDADLPEDELPFGVLTRSDEVDA